MRRATVLSVLALSVYSMPTLAQTVIYDPNTLQPQVYPAPQPGLGQQPVYIDPNQPYQQPVQPGYGQAVPQPNYGQPLPQPQPGYVQQPPPDVTTYPQAPETGGQLPYYDQIGTPPAPGAGADEGALAPSGVQDTRTRDETVPSAAAGGDRAPQMSAELSELLRMGERYRAASPGFLEDLKALAEKYRDPLPEAAYSANADGMSDGDLDEDDLDTDAAQLAMSDQGDPALAETEAVPQPVTSVEPLSSDSISTTEYLTDDFTDGNFTFSPEWTVRQGNWIIDPVYGLRAKPPEQATADPIRPKEILNVLLGGEAPSSDQSSQPRAALIEAPVQIPNSFSLAARIVDHEGSGAAHFIMHQGGSDWLGYRLELRSGPQPVVVLTRRGSSGYKDITKVTAPGFTKGDTHELRWARLSDGQMFVILNGKPIITSRDTVFRGEWSGFAFFNAGGDVSIRTIRIAQPIER